MELKLALKILSEQNNGNIKFPIIEKREFLETSISMLDLDTRSNNVLKRNGITNIKEILDNMEIIPKTRGCGERSINKILYKICTYYYGTLDEKGKENYLKRIIALNGNG